jgi:membrane protease YdiL (CAAX protease family)
VASLEEDQQQPAKDAPSEATPAAVHAQAVRFCRTCGAAWESDWDNCRACAARTVAAPGRGAEQYREDRGRVKSAVCLYFALLMVSIIMIVVVLANDGHVTVGIDFTAQIAMSLITVGWCVVQWRDVTPLLRKSAPPVYFLIAAGAAVVTFIVASLIVKSLSKFTGMVELHYDTPFKEAKLGVGWIILSICVQPAIFEELAFRGAIFGALERVLGGNEALLVSALMFAILHLSIPSIPHLFLLALVLGWLRMRTGSIFPCMLMHFSHNLLVVVAEQNRSYLPW